MNLSIVSLIGYMKICAKLLTDTMPFRALGILFTSMSLNLTSIVLEFPVTINLIVFFFFYKVMTKYLVILSGDDS